jgi:hypothetical protein
MVITGNSTRQFTVILPATPERILLNANHNILTDSEEVKFIR